MKIVKMNHAVALLCAVLNLSPVLAQPARPTPPVRDPNTPGYVPASAPGWAPARRPPNNPA